MLRRLIPGIAVILVGLGLAGREVSRLQAAPELVIAGQFGGASYAVALRQALESGLNSS